MFLTMCPPGVDAMRLRTFEKFCSKGGGGGLLGFGPQLPPPINLEITGGRRTHGVGGGGGWCPRRCEVGPTMFAAP